MSPLTILLDEFSNIAYPGFVDAVNKGGGARAHFMLAMQSLADPEAAMGRDGTQRVLDNLNTRVWFRLSDDKTAKLATEGLGLANVSHAQVGYSLGFGGGRAHSASVGGGLQHVEKPLIRSEWLTAMPRGEALVRLKGENWKLRVPLLAPVSRDETARRGRALRAGRGAGAVARAARRGPRARRCRPLPSRQRRQLHRRPGRRPSSPARMNRKKRYPPRYPSRRRSRAPRTNWRHRRSIEKGGNQWSSCKWDC